MSASEGSSIGRHGDEAALRHWRRSFLDCIELPVDATVIGQPVIVLEIIYDGNPRLGLTIRCRTGDNEEHLVALADVRFHEDTNAARLSERYQRWLAHDPEASPVDQTPGRKPGSGVHIADTSPVELIVLSVKERAARCRLLSFDHTVTLRATRSWDVVPGEIVTVRPRRRWRYARSQYLSGDIVSTRLDVTALGLTPLVATRALSLPSARPTPTPSSRRPLARPRGVPGRTPDHRVGLRPRGAGPSPAAPGRVRRPRLRHGGGADQQEGRDV